MTCPTCRNTGAVGDRYCTCPAATALRARVAPLVADTNAQIDLLRARPSMLAVPMGSCARCRAPMHPLQNGFRSSAGVICHACHTAPDEPRLLRELPVDEPTLN